MLAVEPRELAARAQRLAAASGASVVQAVARVGGGALPLLELEGPAVALERPGWEPHQLAHALREGDPPMLARVSGGQLLVDPRTLAEDELDLAAAVIARALAD